MSDKQNQSQSLDFSTTLDTFDAGGMHFFDFSDSSTDLASLDVAQTDLHDFPQTADTTILQQVQWPSGQMCTCQTLVLELYNRIKTLELCINGPGLPRDDDEIAQRLSVAEARIDDQKRVQTSLESEIRKHHKWITYYDEQGGMFEGTGKGQ